MLNKKHIAIVAITGLSSLVMLTNASAIESANGIYFGGQLGYGNTYATGFNSETDKGGVAGRLFEGYKFNNNVALEAGYTKFSDMKSTISSDDESLTATFKSYAVDLVVKGIVPIVNGFDLYGKVGAAYLNDAISFSADTPEGTITDDGVSETHDKIMPTFGLGASYTFNPNLTADVSWMRIQKTSNESDQLPSTDFVGVGLTYSLG